MDVVLPKGTILSVRAEGGAQPINITLNENLHFTPVYHETPEQVVNQLQIAGLYPLVEKAPEVMSGGEFNPHGAPFAAEVEKPVKKKAK